MNPISVVGSINIDLVLSVPHFPESGETVAGGDLQIFPGGKGANQAVAAARLGADVTMIGRVGDDDFGHQCLDTLSNEGVDTSGVLIDSETPTGIAQILLDPDGHNQIALSPGANFKVDAEQIRNHLPEGPGLVGGVFEVPTLAIDIAFQIAANSKSTSVLNAAPPLHIPASLLANTNILVVNEMEATTHSGIEVKGVDTAIEAAKRLCESGQLSTIVTLGDKGAIISDGNTQEHHPAFKVRVTDTTAAGDTFCGALMVAITEGMNTTESLRFASAAGALAATKMGAQTSLPNRSEVDEFLSTSEQS